MRLRVLAEADDDIANVLRYGTDQLGFDHAWAYAEELADVFDLLAEQPRLGRERNDLADGLRMHAHRAHAIYYRIEPDALVIVRVLHSSQDASRHLP